MVIVSWFWMVGAIVLSLLPALVKGDIGGTEGVVTMCLAVFAIVSRFRRDRRLDVAHSGQQDY